MGLTESVRTCLRKYATFSGRARRSEFWFFQLGVLVALVVTVILRGLAALVEVSALSVLAVLLYVVVALGALVPSLAVTWRRLHDTGRSGAYYFLSLIPVVGPILVLIPLVRDSEPAANAYGPSPKAPVPSQPPAQALAPLGAADSGDVLPSGSGSTPEPGAGAKAPASEPEPELEVLEPQPWDEQSLEALLVELGFQDYVQAVLEQAGAAALLVRSDSDTSRRGASRWGGWPDLSGSERWPQTADGEPLAFVLQLDLADVAALELGLPLPAQGLLSVFADARGGPPELVHSEAGAALKRLRAPGVKQGEIADSLPESGCYPVSALELLPTLTLPGDLGARIDVEDEDVLDLLDTVDGDGPLHRVGGWPRELTEPVVEQAARAAQRPGTKTPRRAADFTFVLQLDTDPPAGLEPGAPQAESGLTFVLVDKRARGANRLICVTQTG